MPAFKKGKKGDPDNNTPESHTSVPGTIMEKIILGGTENHLKDNADIGHSKHRFNKSGCQVLHLAQGNPGSAD